MRADEFTRKAKRNSTIYLDMDGVLADFFAEYAKLANVKTYRDIPPAKVDPILDSIAGTEFFGRLPKFPTTNALVKLAISYAGSYSICSSPLRGDFENTEYWKRVWIKGNLNPQPQTIEITSNKPQHAVTNGVPNILIDDKGSNVRAWIAAGGIGIKYQADEDSLDKVKRALDAIYCEVSDTCDWEDEDTVEEAWSEKYKKSINCNNPKGFSQRAHCDGRKKKTNEGNLLPNPPNTFLAKADTAYDHYRIGTNIANLKSVPKGSKFDEPDIMIVPYAGKKEMKYLMKQLDRIGYETQPAPGYVDTHYDEPEKELEENILFLSPREETNEMSYRDATKLLKKHHYHLERQHGGHEIWKDEEGHTFALPHKHHGKDIAKGIEHALKKEVTHENFADGKKPGRKGLAKRMGVDCSKSETALRKIAKSSTGEKQRMAHWCANMKSGKKK